MQLKNLVHAACGPAGNVSAWQVRNYLGWHDSLLIVKRVGKRLGRNRTEREVVGE